MKEAFPQVTLNLRDGINEWVEIDQEAYEFYKEILEPIRTKETSFLAGEADFELANGIDIRLACKQENGNYYAKYMTLEQYDSGDETGFKCKFQFLTESEAAQKYLG